MRGLFLFIIIIAFTACRHKETANEKRLRDTLTKLRIGADFKPLSLDEAYDFMNNCYLKRMDSIGLGRRIFIYPLTGTDYHKIFEKDSTILTARYRGDTAKTKTETYLNPPPPLFKFDDKVSWDQKKLINTAIIKDTCIINFYKHPHGIDFEARAIWYKQIKPGYMMVSYPQYNAHTNRLFIHEWIEDASACGTGRGREFVFNKINGVWTLQK